VRKNGKQSSRIERTRRIKMDEDINITSTLLPRMRRIDLHLCSTRSLQTLPLILARSSTMSMRLRQRQPSLPRLCPKLSWTTSMHRITAQMYKDLQRTYDILLPCRSLYYSYSRYHRRLDVPGHLLTQNFGNDMLHKHHGAATLSRTIRPSAYAIFVLVSL
jgi:hypothetical protein